MSHLTFNTSKDLPPQHLDALFAAIGWRQRGAEKWREVLSKTSSALSIWDGARLVAFGRIVEDGVMCMLYDIGVLPDYQGQGIGAQLMQALLERVKDKKYASIGLFAWEANPANIPFYQRFGFEVMSTGMECVKLMQRE